MSDSMIEAQTMEESTFDLLPRGAHFHFNRWGGHGPTTTRYVKVSEGSYTYDFAVAHIAANGECRLNPHTSAELFKRRPEVRVAVWFDPLDWHSCPDSKTEIEGASDESGE